MDGGALIGARLSHYRLAEQIGAGGMGEVWRARDERLERDVALKVLLPGLIADEAARKRFRREALALSKLNHPHIATVFDFDREGGHDFLVMEYVGGAMLGAHRGEGGLAETEVVRLGLQLAEGLGAAHGEGIVHRDLKPANVRLTVDGRLKILDFGLAQLAHPAGDRAGSAASTVSAPMTQLGALLGTLEYMAPEQVRGERVDARTDLWAAGLVLYELATGRRAYEDTGTAPLMHAILNESVAAPRKVNDRVSGALEAIILKCLEKDPARRYASARALVEDLERLQGGLSVAAERARTQARRLRTLAVAGPVTLVVLLAALAVFDLGGVRSRLFTTSGIRTLAVLPLENLSGDPDQEFFADGMTEELISRLAQIGALRVSSRSSVMAFKGTRTPVPEIARRLKVTTVLEGSVRRSGDRIRVAVRLVQATTDKNLWGASYERGLEDIFALQSEVAQSIAARVRVTLTPHERTRLAVGRRVDPAAHDEYLRGRFYWNQFTEAGFRKSLEHFNRSIEIDPTFALAYVGVADAYAWLSSLYMPPGEATPKAAAAVEKALELDPELPEAYATRGYVRAFHQWKWREAEADFKRTIAISPGNAVAHLYYGSMLVALGEFDEAIAELREAHELDPLSRLIETLQLYPLFEGRRYDEAIAAANRVIAGDSLAWRAHGVLEQALLQKGETERAIGLIRNRIRATKEGGAGAFAYPHALQGKRDLALSELEQLKAAGDNYGVAVVYAALGMKDEAFEWLDADIRLRKETVLFLKVDPQLDPLRSDRRFGKRLEQLGLAP